jgi:CRISPR system Cascade subunit CasA
MSLDCERKKEMSRFSLLDEPWISVLVEKTGEKREVSLLEFFQNAGSYRSLAGEMETQNFAVMRFLLSIIQTVFSRFDFNGNTLPGINLDENWVQTNPVDEDDLDDYCDAVSECWDQLYKAGEFPDIVSQYLEKWRAHFYLFDEEYPFYQVNEQEMDDIMSRVSKGKKPTVVYGKNLNRTISESENKTALFSPIVNVGRRKRSRKDILTEAEFTRWLLTYQGYSGLTDKAKLVDSKQRRSKGWLFDIGGIFLQGSSEYETLVMNYLPESPTDNQEFSGRVQNPCWETDGLTFVGHIQMNKTIDNLSELYTNWSRAIFIDPDFDMSQPVEINVVMLPEIEHTEKSIEPMTLWFKKKNDKYFAPKKHNPEQSLWRSFGIITMNITEEGEHQRRPGIFDQYRRLASIAGNRWTDIVGVSMKSDGNAQSRLPADEIVDSFQINDLVLTDYDKNGWIVRINDTVENTKFIISVIFRDFLKGICEIRNMGSKGSDFIAKRTAEMYAAVDDPFKSWLSSITADDSKEEKILAWNNHFRKMVLTQGNNIFENSTVRDLTGIETKSGTENIATLYWRFVYRVNNKLGFGGKN